MRHTGVYRSTVPPSTRGSRGLAAGAVLLLTLLLSGLPAGAGTPAFTEETAAAGVQFTHMPLDSTPGNPMHGGGTAADFNNDGWPDLFIVGGGNALDRLFINNGDGTFSDQTAAWFGSPANQPYNYRGNGANAGDYNNDGWIDIFVTSMGDLPGDPEPGKHRLYRNNGDGTFTNVAAQAGVNQTAPYADGYGTTFGDYDLDGDLDLWVGSWHLNGQELSQGTRLFRNEGDGTFTDVSQSAGTYDNEVRGFGAIFADMNGDRYPELLVAGDFGTSRYYANNRDGTFTRMQPLLPGSDRAWNGMGTTVADVDRDGDLDWFVTAIYPAWKFEGPPGSRLYINEGNHTFSSLPESGGVNDGGWGWGAIALDFDHDGFVDLAHTNGWPDCDPVTTECFTNEPTYLFRNQGDLTFVEVGQTYGLDSTGQGRCMMHLDYDADGDMDVVVLSNREDLGLFRNDLSGPGTNWLQLVLDTSGNPAIAPNGWGSNVTVTSGGVKQTWRVTGGSNYLCGSEPIVHFGFRNAASADVVVQWPDGFRTTAVGVAANQRLTVRAPLPYSVQAGPPFGLQVKGLLPGEKAVFGGSNTGTGDGPCPPDLGGLCVDLLGPITLLGSAVANSEGVASLAVNSLPAYSQAVIKRGPGGIRSLKTNVIQVP